MNVLHLNTESGWRGGENQMLLLVKGLRATQVNQHVCLLANSEASRRFKSIVPVLEISAKGGFNPIQAVKVAAYCRDNQIDILDAHSSKTHSLALLIKLLHPRLKLIVHRRVDNHPGRDPVNRWKYQTDKVDQYVAISAFIKSVLLEHHIPTEKITVVPSAVTAHPASQADRTEARRALCTRLGISPDSQTTIIGTAAAMTEQKGYPTLINACEKLVEREANFVCVIAGDGALRDKIKQLVVQKGLEKFVHFLGFVEDVAAVLKGLDVFVLASNNEGLGTVIQDATWAGLPVVASRVGGIPEMLEHDKTGLLADVGDASQFAALIKRLIDSPLQRTDLNAAAREHLSQNFSLSKMVEGNFHVYERILRNY